MKKRLIAMGTGVLTGLLLFAGCGAALESDTEDVAVDAFSAEVAAEESEEPQLGLIFEIPQGFVEDEEMSNLYLSEEYEKDYACIYYQEAVADERYSLLTEEKIEELMQEIYADTYGKDTLIDVVDFHRFNLDGHEAYYTECEFTVDDVPLQTVEYAVIAGEQIFSVTYVQKQNAGWKAAFAQSAENIKVRQ